jgi:hypothetical protein
MAEAAGESTGQGALQRIERLLTGLARAKRQPNRREAYYVRDALDHLRAGRPLDADQAIVRAERLTPVPPEVASQLATNRVPTLEELRTELGALFAASKDSG